MTMMLYIGLRNHLLNYIGTIFQGKQPDGVRAWKRDTNPSAKRPRRFPLCQGKHQSGFD